MKTKNLIFKMSLTAALVMGVGPVKGQEGTLPQPIMLTESKEPIEDRLARKITLDVRDMNVTDVIKFLAQKGEFNINISPVIEGHITVVLHDVGIKEALKVIAASNKLAYRIEEGIVQIMPAQEFAVADGKPFSDKTVTEVVHLQYAKPNYVIAALDGLKSNLGKITIDEDTGAMVLVDTPEAIERMKKAIEGIEQPLETKVYNLQYATAEYVVTRLRPRIDAKSVGTIAGDERSNQVIIRVLPGRLPEVEKMIRALDEPTRRVLIEAHTLQITLKPKLNKGIDWAGFIKESGKTKFNIQSVLLNSNIGSVFAQIAFGNIDVDDFVAAVQLLEEVGSTKIVSSPQVLVTNNEQAKIHVGDTIPYIVTTTNGIGETSKQSEDIRFVEAGFLLDVTPVINKDGMVSMRIRPETSSVVGEVKSATGGIPLLSKTEIETSVMVRDGMTVVMAGLKKEDKQHIKRGIPGLMDIPYAGELFSNTSDEITSTETVILITPHVLKGTDDYQAAHGKVKESKPYAP